ncbi:hypothetical protein FTV88_0788 [Heliorestis convoluta]|uniref:Uncharacterized protein n=1 Tax=Heliorestis convoluta TaxID=356322 RepID=A0A5Q2MWP1_9FIRM|nr:hypothetical protein FTV88_0788 [Heliorestis convoluta]
MSTAGVYGGFYGNDIVALAILIIIIAILGTASCSPLCR